MGQSVYDIITDRIIQLLTAGTVPWRKPWRGAELPTNLRSGRPYRGVNTFLLACAPYASPYWLTFRQAGELGGQVRKGEKGFPVIFWRWLDRKSAGQGGDLDQDDAPRGSRVPMIRYYTVFNAEQVDGLTLPAAASCPAFEPIARCESVVTSMPTPPAILHGAAGAFYRPSLDEVHMPRPEQFSSSAEYYSTLFHELGHATGHASRLARKGVTEPTRFASHEYSREELVAEMTAAYLCGHCGIEPATMDNQAAYLSAWLQILRGDTKLVVQAAASAQKAADLIFGRVFEQESTEPAAEAA